MGLHSKSKPRVDWNVLWNSSVLPHGEVTQGVDKGICVELTYIGAGKGILCRGHTRAFPAEKLIVWLIISYFPEADAATSTFWAPRPARS